MSGAIIEVEQLSKRYQLGSIGVTTLREEFTRLSRALLGKEPAQSKREFWALKEVSFSIEAAEVVGIIGRNGAGKSTLLKLLSRITEPTSGRALMRGRVASLLEVGTGFHPDLTGRENVFLNGALLGMNRQEIRGKLDEIVAFAEVGEFLDTPVKRYSSGMYVRLAFAVAAHLEPEILIIDEVLAVGDAQFQKKCIGKMRDVAKNQGRTVLFVSHDLSSITALTQRCIFLEKGRLVEIGPTARVVGSYFGRSTGGAAYTAAGSGRVDPHVRSVRLFTSEPGAVQSAGQPMEIQIEIAHLDPVPRPCVSIVIVNQFQQPATHSWIYYSDRVFADRSGITRLTCTFPRIRLNVGHYSFRVYFSEPPGGKVFDELDNVCPFEIVRLGEITLWGWRADACIYHEDHIWTIANEIG